MRREEALAVAGTGVTMFVWGVVLALAPLMTSWPMVSRGDVAYLLVASPSALLVGNLVIGRLTDRIGRKGALTLDMALFTASIPFIAFSNSFVGLAVGVALAEFSLGGDETTVLAYMSELSGPSSRGRVLVGVTNLANVGALAISAVSMLTSFSFEAQREAFVSLLAASVPVLVITRLWLPESDRWSRYRSGPWRVSMGAWDYFVRLYFLLTMAITVVLTYALMAIVMGPYLFPSLTSEILFVYNLGESLAGFAAMPFVDSHDRRAFTMLAYLGGAVTMALFVLQYYVARASVAAFMSLLFANGVFGELAWAVRVIMEPELFPTTVRGTMIGVVRAAAYALYIGSIFFTQPFTVPEYLLYNVGLWLVGVSGAGLWFARGLDTSRRSLDEVSDRFLVLRRGQPRAR